MYLFILLDYYLGGVISFVAWNAEISAVNCIFSFAPEHSLNSISAILFNRFINNSNGNSTEKN